MRVPQSRRQVVELLRFARDIPSVPQDYVMALAELRERRERLQPRVSWTVVMTKAFALVAEKYPELRQTYIPAEADSKFLSHQVSPVLEFTSSVLVASDGVSLVNLRIMSYRFSKQAPPVGEDGA